MTQPENSVGEIEMAREQASEIGPRKRLAKEGAALFAEKGFAGASVREICQRARTSSNMIHHYYGSKRGLYDAILAGFSDSVFVTPLRIIEGAPRNVEDLLTRFELFCTETMEALIAHADTYRIVVRELIILDAFVTYTARFTDFVETAKNQGFIRQNVDSSMLTGMVMDRLGNQIIYASAIQKMDGSDIISDADYRKRWLKANIDLILHGFLVR